MTFRQQLAAGLRITSLIVNGKFIYPVLLRPIGQPAILFARAQFYPKECKPCSGDAPSKNVDGRCKVNILRSTLTYHFRDEHSSCKQDMPPSRFVKSTPTQAKAEELQQFQAPMVPAMIPKPMNIIPGFPILQELPNAVAEAVNAMPVFDREPIPYHTARMPTRGSFDSLLTAVNAVSKVDAPIPQGRNGLVVSHLDAQATAAEHNARSFLPPAFRNQGRQHVFHAREQLPAIGLGISQAGGPPVSLDTVPSSQDEKASSETQQAPTSLEMETMPAAVGVAPLKMDQSSSPYQDQSKDESKKDRRTSSRRSAISKQEQKALGLSVSPGPDRKKLKV